MAPAKAQESIALPITLIPSSPIDFRAAFRFVSLTRKRRSTAVRDPSAGRASPNRCSDLAFGERAGRDGIDRPAAAGISATSGMMPARRQEASKNQLRQLAAQHTLPYTPPRHATVRDVSKSHQLSKSDQLYTKPSEWDGSLIRSCAKHGMQESKRGTLTVNASAEDEEHSVFVSS
jgi:hypothetical protein